MNSRCAIAAWLECFQEKSSWSWNEQVCQGRISVTRFERSNGLDTALSKNIPLPLPLCVASITGTITLQTCKLCKETPWVAEQPPVSPRVELKQKPVSPSSD